MDMANIASEITKIYFDILEAQNNIELAKTKLHNADTNYTIEKRRFELGVSTEDKLLQLELQQLLSKQQIEQANNSFQSSQQNLRSYLSTNDNYQTILPDKLPAMKITLQQALDSARRHRPEVLAFVRKRFEAQSNTAKAKADKRQVNINASYGLNKAADNLTAVYQNPNDQQRFSIGFTIPVADWGRRKTRYNAALAEEKLVEYANKLDEANYITEISNLVNSLPILKTSITMALQADTIAQKRFAITNRLYQLSKAGLLDLQVAQNEKDNARRNYFSAIRNYWEAYYLLKKLTLSD
jgi:outer membrane protein TolC